MPEIETKNARVKAFTGIHLFHANMSNCSQRTRMALEEKGISWMSHHLDLMNNEHTKGDYQTINPNGVVPTLIHNGRTIIESVDIIQYVDDLGDGPSLIPDDPALKAEMDQHLEIADGIQGAIKILSHEFLFKPVRKMNARQLAKFKEGHHNEALVAFLEEFSKGFTREKLETAVGEFDDAFNTLEASLNAHGGPWLLGEEFSLSDIAWIVNVHRMDLMRWDFSPTPQLKDWLSRMKARPSYKPALADWEVKGANGGFAVYTLIRRLMGSGVNSFRQR